jgi:hypothetical protein
MAKTYRAGDRVFAFKDRPDVVLSLVCSTPERWLVTVFDFSERQAVLADHAEPSLDRAKHYAGTFVAQRYGADLGDVTWREVLVIRPSGPSG